jgi:23S rRNA pseudouridine2605 synthase
VDGKRIPEPSSKLYLMLNKPFGYITSLNDPKGRPIITDLLKDVPQRVFPVGRLDFDSLGLLLITNDGDWAHHLMHPRYSIPRTYKVTVSGKIVPDAITALKRGVLLEDGPSGRSKVTLISCNQRQSLLRMTIYQGKSRQIRRMMEAVGYKVVHLIRIGFGNLTLGNLKIGEYRHLEAGEIESVASV